MTFEKPAIGWINTTIEGSSQLRTLKIVKEKEISQIITIDIFFCRSYIVINMSDKFQVSRRGVYMAQGKTIQKVERSNLVDSVTQQLITLIENGIWMEGEKVPSENQMATEFNVGRGVIREALQRLRSRNMIVTHHGLGSFVCNPENFHDDTEELCKLDLSESDYKSLADLRACIETRAIILSASNATENDFSKIQEALESMKHFAEIDDLDGFTAADLRFHLAIVESTHSSMLIKAYTSCRRELYSGLYEMNKVKDSYKYALRTHSQICVNVCSRNPEQALQVMEKMHLFNNVRYAGLLKAD